MKMPVGRTSVNDSISLSSIALYMQSDQAQFITGLKVELGFYNRIFKVLWLLIVLLMKLITGLNLILIGW